MRDTADSRIVGRVPFTEGIEREVYEDRDGRQWAVAQARSSLPGRAEFRHLFLALGRPRFRQR
jgi:hypothetical protein